MTSHSLITKGTAMLKPLTKTHSGLHITTMDILLKDIFPLTSLQGHIQRNKLSILLSVIIWKVKSIMTPLTTQYIQVSWQKNEHLLH